MQGSSRKRSSHSSRRSQRVAAGPEKGVGQGLEREVGVGDDDQEVGDVPDQEVKGGVGVVGDQGNLEVDQDQGDRLVNQEGNRGVGLRKSLEDPSQSPWSIRKMSLIAPTPTMTQLFMQANLRFLWKIKDQKSLRLIKVWKPSKMTKIGRNHHQLHLRRDLAVKKGRHPVSDLGLVDPDPENDLDLEEGRGLDVQGPKGDLGLDVDQDLEVVVAQGQGVDHVLVLDAEEGVPTCMTKSWLKGRGKERRGRNEDEKKETDQDPSPGLGLSLGLEEGEGARARGTGREVHLPSVAGKLHHWQRK